MANNLLDTQATASAGSPSVLDQLDPQSPVMTVIDESFSSSEPRGVSLEQEFEDLNLSENIFYDSEDEASSADFPIFEDHLLCCSQNATDPAPSSDKPSDSADGPVASDTSTLFIENSPGAEHVHTLFNPYFMKDNFKYYRDMKSLYPVADHLVISYQQFELFCYVQRTLFDAPLVQVPHARYLEIGCGAGYWAKTIAHKNPEIKVIGIDSTCFGPRTDNDPLNYQFVNVDLVNTTASFDSAIGIINPFGQHVRPQIDYIRCTRMNGRVSTWSDLCRKLYLYAKHGTYVEVYDVLPEHAIQSAEHQPTWAMVPCWYKECSRMRHMPHLSPREWAGCAQIQQHLETAGFTRTRIRERTVRLNVLDEKILRHVQSLAREAVGIAHLIGVPVGYLDHYYDSLMREASAFGLEISSFTVCAQKPEDV